MIYLSILENVSRPPICLIALKPNGYSRVKFVIMFATVLMVTTKKFVALVISKIIILAVIHRLSKV